MYAPAVVDKPVAVEKKRYLEAVCVSVGYSDFLCWFLPLNLRHFDKLVIVTDTKDTATQRLCEAYGVECVVTDCFYENGAKFNKGKGINAGLVRLTKQDWVLHIDSDIILSNYFSTVFQNIYLDPKGIHGWDRMNCTGFTNWINYFQNPAPSHQHYYLVHGNHFPLGARVAHYNQLDGWFPIGYSQLWRPKSSNIYTYPEEWIGADHTDVVFAKSFPVAHRRFIAEMFCIHLDSPGATMGSNWNGRKTLPFKPEICPPVTIQPVLTIPVIEPAEPVVKPASISGIKVSRWSKFVKWFKNLFQ